MKNKSDILKELRDKLEKISPYPWDSLEPWISSATLIIKKYWPDYFSEFQKVATEPRRVVFGRMASQDRVLSQCVNVSLGQKEAESNKNKADTSKKKLLAFIESILEIEGIPIERDSVSVIILLCRKFHNYAVQLKKRQRGRSTILINDEYDLQDHFHAILKIHFDDIRTEEWTPSYAGSSSKIDFLIKKEKIAIELKRTRDTLKDRKLGNEIIEDIAHYKEHKDVDNLICFIYDPENYISNPNGLERDLSKQEDEFKIMVIIRPK